MDFYSEKSRDLPRFFYRELLAIMSELPNPQERPALIAKFCEYIGQLQPSGDWQKMKWSMPAKLRAALSVDEQAMLDEALGKKRKRRNDLMVEVYPHCSDEFSTEIPFLDAAFGSERFAQFTTTTRLFTLGSCFAKNIARHLASKGFNVTPFVQAEDLNSPFSNAKMLSICAAPEATRRAYITHWVDQLYPKDAGIDLVAEVEKEMQRLEQLIAMLRSSEFLIVTCGNVLDYFMALQTAEFEVGPAVAPKFLAVSYSEDVELRKQLTGKLKKLGAEFRLGDYAEVTQALEALYASIRHINPTAPLLLTLSPIPIDSAIGVGHSHKMGAVELDCISKSLLRCALNDLLGKHKDDEKLFYFPSFEIVRWIAPNMDIASFGREDAASRHVSQHVLSGVYDYFIHKYALAAA